MRIMRLAAIAAVALTAISSAEAKDWSKILIGTEGAYPPFNNLTSDGKLVGFDIEIADAICEELKVECEFVVQDWDGMIPALIAGKFDAVIASMSITEERKQKVDFTGKYYNTPPAIAVPKDSKLTGVTDADLDGVLLGAQSSTTHSNYAEERLPSADLKLYPTPDEYKLDIIGGRIDAVIDDSIVLSDWLKSEDGACCKILGMVPNVIEIHGEGAGIAVRKEDTDLKEMLSDAILAIRENGKYAEINAKYFDFDVYGE
ncbi:MAG: ABC transporter substrate-binding protein [Rhodobacteraceae bacterium]|nr:ABC transporter substrate-binding protein [Paracoccaceae bacterium]